MLMFKITTILLIIIEWLLKFNVLAVEEIKIMGPLE